MKTLPRLLDLQDGNNLVQTAALRPLQGGFRHGEHVALLHPAIPNPLAALLIRIAEQGGDLRVRLDPTRAISSRDYKSLLLEELLYGPSFDPEKTLGRLYQSNIRTVFEPSPAHPLICRLEVNRKEEQQRISLMAEELLLPGDGETKTLMFHCDLDPGTRRFHHVDASLLIYGEAGYQRRFTATIRDKVKADKHLKLFWLGDCSLELWSQLFRATFPRTTMVHEYLGDGGESDEGGLSSRE